MRVLSIESSCDETSAAIVSVAGGADQAIGPNWRPVVEGHVVSSQVDLHKRYGGVVPELASRAHLEAILPTIESAFDKAGCTREDVDFIATTRGPGLIGALLMGVETAKCLSLCWDLPLLPVHHLAGHIMASYLAPNPPELPFLCLLVSGGHSALYAVHGPTDYRMLGQTRDDAAGEAFDKGARMLGLPYPGGAHIDRRSDDGDRTAFAFPLAMKHSKDLDFSFSGVKTSLRQKIRAMDTPPDEACIADLCASYQEAIANALVYKTRKAVRQTQMSRLVVAGGVARNRRIRGLLDEMAEEEGVQLHLVPMEYCTDNAAMIGVAALAAPSSAWLPAGHESALCLDASPNCSLDSPFGVGNDR